jgi:DNA-binding NtrC family response regulator
MLRENRIDLVITDVRMRDIDDMEVLHRVRDFNADIPVIIVTAYADTDMAILAINEGAFAFLQKPISPTTLDASINEAFTALTQRRQEQARLEELEKTTA